MNCCCGHYDAIILETFGIGGIPEYDDSFEKAIFGWVDSGKTLAVTTQVPEEGCDLEVYQVGKKYSEHPGILQAADMTTEALVAKLMWFLDRQTIRKKSTAYSIRLSITTARKSCNNKEETVFHK